MKRREFIRNAGAVAAFALVPSVGRSAGREDGGAPLEPFLRVLSALNDKKLEAILPSQIRDGGSRWRGGFADEFRVPNTHATVSGIVAIANAYASPYSENYLSAELEQPLLDAVACLRRVQHDDGTIDLHSTNFHSPPDTGFLVLDLSPVYTNLKRLQRPAIESTVAQLATFLEEAGDGMAVGGIHTANHRWIVCGALAHVYSYFPKQRYVDRIDDWLGEGIDQDPDGQYTERSVGGYSSHIDNVFLDVARLLDRPAMFDIVRKNLDMTLYFMQPGGELMTDAGGRGGPSRRSYIGRYYYAYKYFALKERNPVYEAVCRFIENQMPDQVVNYLSELLANPIFKQPSIQPSKIPDDYAKHLAYLSGIYRRRRGQFDYTVIEGNPTFFTFMKGSAVLQSMRLHAAFFGRRGQFVGESIELHGDQVVLRKHITHGYWQPFPEERRTGDGDWAKLPRLEREMTGKLSLDYTVRISESRGRVKVEVEIAGTEHVPVSLELSFRAGGKLSGVVPDSRIENAYFFTDRVGQYRLGNDVITFTPGTGAHEWAQMRGQTDKQDGESVYLTGYTPFKHTIELS